MSRIKWYILENPEQVGKFAAELFAAEIKAKPDCVLGLATGSTPLPLYQELIDRERSGEIDFSRVRTVNLDEYKGLPPEHPQSYRYFMQKNLFDYISIPPENTILPHGLAEDVDAMCAAYESQINAWGGIDLQLLGIGHDGHIGFNEPGSSFPEITHEVKLTQLTRSSNKRFFQNGEHVPTSAFTMGIGTILAARKIVLLATGAGKAAILKTAFEGEITPKVPASVLRLHPDVTVICDKAAASAAY